ncbi:NAD-P-binding protein [Mycena sp. CBHHK59/15]|nr:NAD-P-binding protein [Mycena sp. CBHHK59/15]
MTRGVVLVTGITGFVGTHTALTFFESGYAVKGTARTAAKAEEWIARFPQWKSQYQYVVVQDMSTPGAFDEAVKGCGIIAHTASPFHWNQGDNEKDMLIPAINGTKNILNATKLESRIERVVLTSSLAAIIDTSLDEPGKIWTHEDWNPATYDEAKVSTNSHFVYRASKALAERAFWDYIRDEKPTWSGTVVCPCGTFGPPLQPFASTSSLNTSVSIMWGIASGTYKNGIPAAGSPVYVDVRDVAMAHLRAAELDVAKNQRYLLIGGSYLPSQLVEVIQHNFPELRDNLPPVDSTKLEVSAFKFDSSKARNELGIPWRPFHIMIVDTIAPLLALQKQGKI